MDLRPSCTRRAGIALLALALSSILLGPTAAFARPAGEADRVRAYWTPQRMASARPLELVIDPRGKPQLHLGRPVPLAAASFLTIATPTAPPNSVNGRIFIRIGNRRGYCSGTAIDSPTRQLVLTAGHCVNSGAENHGNLWYRDLLEFVPAYTAGRRPFGAFRRPPQQDLRAKAVDGGTATPTSTSAPSSPIPTPRRRRRRRGRRRRHDRPRPPPQPALRQPSAIPATSSRCRSCNSAYAGDDRLTFPLPGPPTLGDPLPLGARRQRRRLADRSRHPDQRPQQLPHLDERSRTYGPYFSRETVGELVAGL